jgi:ATP-dependent Clp protease ATP-binding subunit ClpA
LQVKKFFRPEFLNRLDDIVVFDPLSAQQLLGVARLMAHELNDRLKPKNITLTMTDNALQYAVSQVSASCQSLAITCCLFLHFANAGALAHMGTCN